MVKPLALKPRVIALVVATIGVVLVYVNDKTIRTERQFMPGLLLFGPVAALLGIAGFFDPRAMSPNSAAPGRPLLFFRILNISLVVAGLLTGWAMAHYWYHIW